MRSTRMRWYTASIALATGGAVAVAIDVNAAADAAARSHVAATANAAWTNAQQKRIASLEQATSDQLAQYRKLVAIANTAQTTMLADLHAARKAAETAQNVKLASITYRINTGWSGPAVVAGGGGGPATGTS